MSFRKWPYLTMVQTNVRPLEEHTGATKATLHQSSDTGPSQSIPLRCKLPILHQSASLCSRTLIHSLSYQGRRYRGVKEAGLPGISHTLGQMPVFCSLIKSSWLLGGAVYASTCSMPVSSTIVVL